MDGSLVSHFARAALLIVFCLRGVALTSHAGSSCENDDPCDATSLLQKIEMPKQNGMNKPRAWHASMPSPWEDLTWFCFDYAFGQDGKWCAKTRRIGALELRYSEAGAGPCGGTCECCARSAAKIPGAARPLPPPPGRAVKFVTVESSSQEVELGLVPGVELENVGYGKPWNGLISKTENYRDYVRELAASAPNAMVVLIDTDIGYGGCSEEELLTRYHAVVEASGGASVVVSGDPVLYPASPHDAKLYAHFWELVRSRRGPLFRKLGLNPGSWEAFMSTYPQPDLFKVGTRNEYIFLNSGFVMGPVKDLLWFLECSIKQDVASDGKYNDQLAGSMCSMQEPGKIAIDYSALIVTGLRVLRNNIVQIQGNRIVNNLAGQTQCFVHACGPEIEGLKPWLKSATKAMRRAR